MSGWPCLVLRWLARLSAVLIAVLFLLMVAGEMVFTHSGMPTRTTEWLTFGLFTVAMISMVLAWKWELPGALISLACLALFAAVVPLPGYGAVAVASLPSVLFLADYALKRFMHPHAPIH